MRRKTSKRTGTGTAKLDFPRIAVSIPNVCLSVAATESTTPRRWKKVKEYLQTQHLISEEDIKGAVLDLVINPLNRKMRTLHFSVELGQVLRNKRKEDPRLLYVSTLESVLGVHF